jgi:hypothetical protein
MRRIAARVQALPLTDRATLFAVGSLGLLLVVVLLLIVPLVGAT